MFGAIGIKRERAAARDLMEKPPSLAGWRERNERAAVDRLAQLLSGMGQLGEASLTKRNDILRAVAGVVPHVDLARTGATADRYGRRVLREEPTGWSLAAITLRYGQATEAHDHSGWGGAVTVTGLERDRRFALEGDQLVLIAEVDYAAGEGYLFDLTEIHQPVGADPEGETVALHFLFPDHASGAAHQHLHEVRAEVAKAA